MKQSDIRFIRDGVFEFQKGHGDQTPGGDDIVQIQFGGIQTAVTSKQSGEKDDVYLPSPLEEDKLETISVVARTGAYTDDECCVPTIVLKEIRNMTLGQGILIRDEDAEDKEEEGHKGVKIYAMKLLTFNSPLNMP